MSRFVNYKKRSVQLPPGCTDLIDLLQGARKVKVSAVRSGTWVAVPKPERVPTGGLAHIERYVTRLLDSTAKFTAVCIASLDEKIALGLYRRPGEARFDLMLYVDRAHKEREEGVRALFTQHGIEHSLDYLAGGIGPGSVRGLRYPLPCDAEQAACLIVELLKGVFKLPEDAGLEFTFNTHETAA